jgi:hypothetical protein
VLRLSGDGELTLSAFGHSIKAGLISEEQQAVALFSLRGKKLVAAGGVPAA